MANLIDKLRSGSETWKNVQVHGFDPDLRTCGHAVINAHYRTDVLGTFTIDSAIISRIDASNSKLVSIKQADSMVEAIHAYGLYSTAYSVSFIESQQVYPNEEEDLGKKVAVANDLIRLSHVAGAYHLKALSEHHTCYVMLPAEWKGNRPKPAMHEDVVKDVRLKAPRINPFRIMVSHKDGTRTHEQFDLTEMWRTTSANYHTLDALCLAYKGLLRVVRGESLIKKGT
jgi:hypothetical protein